MCRGHWGTGSRRLCDTCLDHRLKKASAGGPVGAGRSDRRGYSATSEPNRPHIMDISINSSHNPSVFRIDVSPAEAVARQSSTVTFSPAEIVRRQTAHWRGLQAETVQMISHEGFELRFKGQSHLLMATEQA